MLRSTTALLDQLEDLRLGRHVERRSRSSRSRVEDRPRSRCDHDALAHAAGEFVREGTIALLWSVNLNAREHSIARRAADLSIPRSRAGSRRLFSDPLGGIEAAERVLENHADVVGSVIAYCFT